MTTFSLDFPTEASERSHIEVSPIGTKNVTTCRETLVASIARAHRDGSRRAAGRVDLRGAPQLTLDRHTIGPLRPSSGVVNQSQKSFGQ